jgi:predicted glycoside hydrolase/deacetylase ChbG (UPF0249 family)
MLLTALMVISTNTFADDDERPKQLLIRCDDVGMSHTVNAAVRELVETGVPFSTSVMIACPWYLEAVEILKANPQIGVGIHLTLNSEWKDYKWGPVLGAAKVPSLVDANGHFFASEAEFAANNVKLDEVERELRAQIERALRAGLRVDYLDYHMLTAVSTPELRAVVERLAEEHGFGLSRYFGEASTPEMSAMVDMNNQTDPYRVAVHRQAELEAITSPAFRAAIEEAGIELLTYKNIVSELGLESMAPPEDLTSYSSSFVEE